MVVRGSAGTGIRVRHIYFHLGEDSAFRAERFHGIVGERPIEPVMEALRPGRADLGSG
jgi:hypothetical protein